MHGPHPLTMTDMDVDEHKHKSKHHKKHKKHKHKHSKRSHHADGDGREGSRERSESPESGEIPDRTASPTEGAVQSPQNVSRKPDADNTRRDRILGVDRELRNEQIG